MGLAKVFSWLHLSDVHFGHGDQAHRWSQDYVTDALLADLNSALRASSTGSDQNALPSPDVVLVTGDIAFKGAPDEYDRARYWISRVVEAAHLTARDVYMVPGNHDIMRTQVSDRQAYRLIRDIREGVENLDEALRDDSDRMILTRRLQNYLRFASEFAPACLDVVSEAEQWLYWSHTIQPGASMNVRIHLVGLNSAVLCNDPKDRGKLQLGAKQLAPLAKVKALEEVRIVLTHHPIEELSDASTDHVKAISTLTDIHLYGHVHEAKIQLTRRGATEDAVQIVAGAVHGDSGDRQEAYSFGAIFQLDDGSLELRVWPRRWNTELKRFVHDSRTGDERSYIPIQLGKARALTKPLSTPPTILKPLLDRLPPGFNSIKARRCVIDTQAAQHWLSLAELHEAPKLLGGNLDPATSLVPAPPLPNDPWKISLLDDIRATTTIKKGAVLLHGIRGVGKSMLLLRYVAAARHDERRIFIDYGNLGDATPEDIVSELRTYLQSVESCAHLFIAVDGLDVACREQAVRAGDPRADTMLQFYTLELLELLDAHPAFIVFSADDPPANSGLEIADPWATKSITDVLINRAKQSGNIDAGKGAQLVFRLLAPATRLDLAVRSRVVPMIAADDVIWSKYPFLQLPVFLMRFANPLFAIFSRRRNSTF